MELHGAVQKWSDLMCVVQVYKCMSELVWRGADEVGVVGER